MNLFKQFFKVKVEPKLFDQPIEKRDFRYVFRITVSAGYDIRFYPSQHCIFTGRYHSEESIFDDFNQMRFVTIGNYQYYPQSFISAKLEKEFYE